MKLDSKESFYLKEKKAEYLANFLYKNGNLLSGKLATLNEWILYFLKYSHKELNNVNIFKWDDFKIRKYT